MNHPKVLRISEFEARVGLSRTTIWRRRREGLFPHPVNLGNGLLGFIEHEIDDWLANRPRISNQAETAAA